MPESTITTVESGRRYWYRWLSDHEAESGLCIGVTPTKALFPSRRGHGTARIVALTDVLCEDARPVPILRKLWWQ